MNPFIGEVRPFGGTFAPQGWAACDGTLLNISDYSALYSLIGTTYGGDGQTTFALPDLRGRMPLHASSQFPYGQSAGAESVTPAQSQLPAHQHVVNAVSDQGNTANPKGAFWASSGTTLEYATATPDTVMNAGTLATAGGGKPHENRMPYLTLMFIIALDGVYPSQS